MQCLDEHNYFGKLLGNQTDLILKAMRFSQVLANSALPSNDFFNILEGGLKATGYALKRKGTK